MPETKSKTLVATAAFEIERNFKIVQYKEGDAFPLPEGWERDLAFEEFRKIDRRGANGGIVFTAKFPVFGEGGKVKDFDSRRVILPLKEV